MNNLELKRTEAQDDLLAEHATLREDYMLRYMLDVETPGSASLLNVAQFTDPFGYKLKISTGSVGESTAVNVDLVETFNWLLGLRVKHMDTIRGFRWSRAESPRRKGVGHLAQRGREVRTPTWTTFSERRATTPRDMEFDLIYVNGDNNLENLRRADETWKVRLIEEDFNRLMFECQDV